MNINVLSLLCFQSLAQLRIRTSFSCHSLFPMTKFCWLPLHREARKATIRTDRRTNSVGVFSMNPTCTFRGMESKVPRQNQMHAGAEYKHVHVPTLIQTLPCFVSYS